MIKIACWRPYIVNSVNVFWKYNSGIEADKSLNCQKNPVGWETNCWINAFENCSLNECQIQSAIVYFHFLGAGNDWFDLLGTTTILDMNLEYGHLFFLLTKNFHDAGSRSRFSDNLHRWCIWSVPRWTCRGKCDISFHMPRPLIAA